jgi:ADP-ribosyltransferase exoenzyme
MAQWEESKHPRDKGKFAPSAGGSATPKPGTKAALNAKAKEIVGTARARAAVVLAEAAAKRKAATQKAAARGKRLTPAARSRINAAHAKAKGRAKEIVAKAKAKVAAMKAKGVRPTRNARTKAKSGPAKAIPIPGSTVVGRALNADEFKANKASFADALIHEEKQAMVTYSGDAFVGINKKLRSRNADKDTAALVGHMDSAMDKSRTTEPIVTFRGSRRHPSFMKAKVGDTFVDNAFVSTSYSEEGAFLHPIQFKITSPSGTKIAPIPSSHGGEGEMLLARGSKFRIDKRENAKDWEGKPIQVFHVTVVGQ